MSAAEKSRLYHAPLLPGEANHPARNSAGFITLGGPASLPVVDRPANHPSTSRRLERILRLMEEGSPADITKPASQSR